MPSLRQRPADTRTHTRGAAPAQLALPGTVYDYAIAAETAWLDAQVAAFEIDDVRAELDAVLLRLGRATEWFEAHGKAHPRYQEAYQRRAELIEAERWARIRRWARMQRCWTACKDCWLSLQRVNDRAGWLAEFAPEIVDASTPLGLWAALRGGVRPPGEWPPARGEEYVRAGQIEWWHRDELAKRLDRRRAIARNRGGAG